MSAPPEPGSKVAFAGERDEARPPVRPPAQAASQTATTRPDTNRRRTDGADPAVAAPPEKKSKKKLVLVVAAVVVLALAGLVVRGKLTKTVYRPGQPVPAGQVVSLGSVTVALADGDLVQAGLDLQMTKPANTKEEASDSAALTNAAILDLGSQTYTALLTLSGREAVQQQLLASFQKILGTSDGAQQVSAVYFTSFVLQQ